MQEIKVGLIGVSPFVLGGLRMVFTAFPAIFLVRRPRLFGYSWDAGVITDPRSLDELERNQEGKLESHQQRPVFLARVARTCIFENQDDGADDRRGK